MHMSDDVKIAAARINEGATAPSEGGSVYALIREDILEGRLSANERLMASALARRYNSSTNPVREALQQLRGEGYVLFSPNRGARVRPIDEDFARDIYEVESLVEPYLTRWFVTMASDEDIARLEAKQQEIELLNFRDEVLHSELDTQFHQIVYERHYNRHAVETWWKHREILRAIARKFSFSSARRKAIMLEHRQLIERIKAGDADGATRVIAAHCIGSGHHIVEHMRAVRLTRV
jgi:DNA-binding GntR family transcriptional regulator